ncbi:MAG: hypothetical protein VYD19_02700 [Myxococcota bacterium]|nr:hypothetical protein [Myxococcota bacterium]
MRISNLFCAALVFRLLTSAQAAPLSQRVWAPSLQDQIFFNARLALRAGQSEEVLRLWLLRNRVEADQLQVSAFDGDLLSVLWVALGRRGVCPEGIPEDEGVGGAGLWPLAAHNFILRKQRERSAGTPFDAFRAGYQRREISLHDLLNREEFERLRFTTGSCRWRQLFLAEEERRQLDMSKRIDRVRLLLYLIERGRKTIDRSRVSGWAVLEARRFDLWLQLIELKRREKARTQRGVARTARRLKLPNDSSPDGPIFKASSPLAALLREAITWPAVEWLALSPDRRHTLFQAARQQSPTERKSEAMTRLILEIIDQLISANQGETLTDWIAWLGAEPAQRRLIWSGERGRRLLNLPETSGFQRRAPIALARGVDALSRGESQEAIEHFALAARWGAKTGQRGEGSITALSLRWLSFVTGRFQLNEALLLTLKTLLRREDYRLILRDQLWGAALSADLPSYERALAALPGRGAGRKRAQRLRPLAEGDQETFVRALIDLYRERPAAALRFLESCLTQLERRPARERLSLSQALGEILTAIEEGEVGRPRPSRRALESQRRLRAILEGLQGLDEAIGDQRRLQAVPMKSAREAQETALTGRQLSLGALRLAPRDLLPWPFLPAERRSPSATRLLQLIPVEREGPNGTLELRWQVRDE